VRILIAHAGYRVPGGEDRYVQQQVELLRPGHDIELLAAPNELLTQSVSTALRMSFSPKMLRSVERRVGSFGPDVIHIHNIYPAIGPAIHLAAERFGIPVVQTIHNLRLRCPNGLMFTEGQLCRRCEAGNYANAVIHSCFPTRSQATAYAGALWIHRFVMRLERKVTAFISPSNFMRDRLLAWGIPARRIWTIRNFVTSIAARTSSSGEYGMFVGRLAREKGIDTLLQALALAGDPPFRIIGEGPTASELATLSVRLRLKNVVFTGRLTAPAVADLLARSRYLVMPSVCEENAPMAVLESMAAGCPILVSRRGGLTELVQDGSGLTFEPGDPQSLAGMIHLLSTDNDSCKRLGVRGRLFAREHLSAEGHREQLEQLYESVIGGKTTHADSGPPT